MRKIIYVHGFLALIIQLSTSKDIRGSKHTTLIKEVTKKEIGNIIPDMKTHFYLHRKNSHNLPSKPNKDIKNANDNILIILASVGGLAGALFIIAALIKIINCCCDVKTNDEDPIGQNITFEQNLSSSLNIDTIVMPQSISTNEKIEKWLDASVLETSQP